MRHFNYSRNAKQQKGAFMTLSSSLNAGVAGLSSNASRLGTISDNIANSSTFGYKRAETDFSSMVLDQSTGAYSAGGVRVTSYREIAQQGALINTDNPTDIALAGQGMLPVTTLSALDGPDGTFPLSLTTTGSFRPDSTGILTSDSGLVLLGWPANPDGEIPDFPRTTADGLEPVQVTLNQFAGNPTTEMQLGVNLPATESEAGASGETLTMSVEYFDNTGRSESLNFDFTPTIPATGASNTWTMVVRDGANGNAAIGEFTVVFDATSANGGAILSVVPVAGGAGGTYDATTGEISITTASGNIQIDVGSPGDTDGLTQLSDTFAPTSVSKNGSPVGNLSSVEIDENGFVVAIYDAGFTRTIYQIPVVDVPDPNGLISGNNQVYQVSNDSGSFFLWDAGDGPTGGMVGFAREQSAVDVARELTALIETQRAYSSNAKVVQTVDEMLQETTNIKR